MRFIALFFTPTWVYH